MPDVLDLVRRFAAKLGDRRYDVSRRDLIPGGFLQEHVLRGTAPDGTTIAMPACIIAAVADGRRHRHLASQRPPSHVLGWKFPNGTSVAGFRPLTAGWAMIE